MLTFLKAAIQSSFYWYFISRPNYAITSYRKKKKDIGICKGCIESDSHCEEWTQSGCCPIHKCTKEHNVQFCGLCNDFPCEWLIQKVVWRPNVVEELTELAVLFNKGTTSTG